MKEKVSNKGTVVEEKKEVKKAAPKKATAEKTATKPVAPVAEKEAAPKKETVKKETVKKETAKKTTPKTGKKEVYVQFGDREISAEDIHKKIEAAYAAEGHKMKESDEVRAYVKPEENMIYYVVNDSYASGINLFE